MDLPGKSAALYRPRKSPIQQHKITDESLWKDLYMHSFLVLPIHRCVIALYTRFFPDFCEKNHMHITRVGFEPRPFAILEQCLTN